MHKSIPLVWLCFALGCPRAMQADDSLFFDVEQASLAARQRIYSGHWVVTVSTEILDAEGSLRIGGAGSDSKTHRVELWRAGDDWMRFDVAQILGEGEPDDAEDVALRRQIEVLTPERYIRRFSPDQDEAAAQVCTVIDRESFADAVPDLFRWPDVRKIGLVNVYFLNLCDVPWTRQVGGGARRSSALRSIDGADGEIQIVEYSIGDDVFGETWFDLTCDAAPIKATWSYLRRQRRVAWVTECRLVRIGGDGPWFPEQAITTVSLDGVECVRQTIDVETKSLDEPAADVFTIEGLALPPGMLVSVEREGGAETFEWNGEELVPTVVRPQFAEPAEGRGNAILLAISLGAGAVALWGILQVLRRPGR